MTWLTWIWWVIKYAPAVISAVRAIIKAIQGIKDASDRESATIQFNQAMTDVKERGDFSGLERMKDRCGLRCRVEEHRSGQSKES